MFIDLSLPISTDQITGGDERVRKIIDAGHAGTHFDVMDKIFPLAEAAAAHARMEAGGHIGKIVLEMSE